MIPNRLREKHRKNKYRVSFDKRVIKIDKF